MNPNRAENGKVAQIMSIGKEVILCKEIGLLKRR